MTLEYKRFPKTEYEKRWERAGKLIADNGLDALLITEANNYTYFSSDVGLRCANPAYCWLCQIRPEQ